MSMKMKKDLKDFAKFVIPASASAGLALLVGPVPVAIGIGALALVAKFKS